MSSNFGRRQFLITSFGAVGALAFSNPIAKAVASTCGYTPAQTSGPFYPGEGEFHSDNDLTWIQGHTQRAKGQIIYLNGKIVDEECKPIVGATVEIWQACASGRYNNPKETNPAPLDPHFKYWAETNTDEEGNYFFKTIIPGAYPAESGWTRPPHIHFKISRIGYRELVTQMYFKGDVMNDHDLILQELPESERERLIVDFQASSYLEPGSQVGNFQITLQRVRRS